MPELPNDPRQLARDILAGRVSIEDLAREQQRRRAAAAGGGGAQPMPQAKVPDRVPLPRPAAPQPPRTPARPLARPVPTRPQQQRQFPPRPPAARPAGPNIDRRPAPRLTQPPVPPAAVPVRAALPQDNAYAAPAGIQDARETTTSARLDVRSIAHNRNTLRQSILMAEVLGKPLSMRHER